MIPSLWKSSSWTSVNHRCPASCFFHIIATTTLLLWAVLAAASRHGVQSRMLSFWMGCQWGAWILLGIAAWKVPQCRGRWVALWAIAFRGIGFLASPVLEDDPFRFLWDGRILIEFGNPYLRAPASYFGDLTISPDFQSILDQINHPHLTTVYGPVAELSFGASYWIAPGKLWPWKLILTLSEGLTWVALFRRISPRAFLLLCWCPLAVAETAFNAHPDSLGIALLTFAWTTRFPILAGIFWAASGGTKVFGWILAPIDLQRRGSTACSACAFMIALLYLPFLLKGGRTEFNGLAAMAHDWEFNSSIYALAGMLFGSSIARAIGAVVFGAVWCYFALGTASLSKQPGKNPLVTSPLPGLPVLGTFFLFSSTVNAWYLLWLLPFVSANPNPVAIAALCLAPLSYCTGGNLGIPGLGEYDQPVWVRVVEYGLLAGVGCFSFVSSMKDVRKTGHPNPS